MLKKEIRSRYGFLGIIICFMLVLAVFVSSMDVRAAVPRLMLIDYSVAEGEVYSGDAFTLRLTFANKASRASIRNVKVSVYSEGGEFYSVGSAGTEYIDRIDAGADTELSFKLQAINGLQEKAYKLNVKTEYEDANSNPYETQEILYVSVRQKTRISVTDVYLTESVIELGDIAEICGQVNNIGEGTIYNVTATITSDYLAEQTSYIGNVEPGKSGTVDLLTKADVVGDSALNKLTICYEDIGGNTYTETATFEVNIQKPQYDKLEKIKESTAKKSSLASVKKALIVIGIVLALILIAYIRFKRKKKLLDEI